MVEVKIVITGEPETDTYSRFFGKAIDQTLKPDFFYTQPEKKLKDPQTGKDFTAKARFVHEQTVDLSEGLHSIAVAPSSPPGYTWEIEVIINDVSQGVKKEITYENQYFTMFNVEKPPPTMSEMIAGMLSPMMSIIMVVIIMSMMRVMMRRFRR